ncbi:Zn-dependent protease with chaperone function [Halalkaliarchaeum sp. AArc-CO]|uniref:M48 family metalloprotease n=1 Tax=Halalkaliarchaeum sp. AArc-CO TaxID=2866381 RepID=UPI00217EFBF1|nr:M48 family metalloprotease [Halalkaliarchaeum sp. AArc-CO]UWG51372.1 Zn-dependent protease with chaperone function [Halalkaliarchaeum sp. AArc-CO]
MHSPDPALRRRILIASALVVLLPFGFIYAFVAAINHVLLPLLESFGHGPYHGRVYVSPLLAVVIVLGGLATQIWFGPSTVLGSIGARRVAPDERPELHAAVTRLAQAADIEPPDVAVTSNDAPNAAAVRGPARASIVVTTGLLDRLDGEELEAVLAHEIAHLKNRDATVMTVAWFLPTVTYYLALAAAYLLYGTYRALGAGSSSGRNGRGLAKAVIVLTVTAVVTIAISALFWAASVLIHRILSRYREYAADRGAATLTGEPAALASALRTLDEEMSEIPDRDLRKLDGGAEALYVAPLSARSFTDAALVSTDIFPDTHPQTEDRIDRLRELAGEVE